MSINALQNSIGQGKRLAIVDLNDRDFFMLDGQSKLVPFLFDLPRTSEDTAVNTYSMNVQFEDGHIGVYTFKEGTSPMVKITKVFNVGSVQKTFQVIY